MRGLLRVLAATVSNEDLSESNLSLRFRLSQLTKKSVLRVQLELDLSGPPPLCVADVLPLSLEGAGRELPSLQINTSFNYIRSQPLRECQRNHITTLLYQYINNNSKT